MFDYDLRVFIEDTDAGGIVYHANYFKYAERARTMFLFAHFPDFLKQMAQDDIIFVVQNAEIEYKKPAFLGDALTVKSDILIRTGVSIIFKQWIVKNDTILVDLKIKVVCIRRDGKVVRLPPYLINLIDKLLKDRNENGSRSITTS